MIADGVSLKFYLDIDFLSPIFRNGCRNQNPVKHRPPLLFCGTRHCIWSTKYISVTSQLLGVLANVADVPPVAGQPSTSTRLLFLLLRAKDRPSRLTL